MIEDDHIYLAPTYNEHWAVLRRQERRRHTLLIGKTGTGKSTLLKQMMQQDLEAGSGFALLDPHGDLALSIADATPKNRTNDVIYLDPSDLTYPVGYNPLQSVPADQRALVAAHVTAAFKHVWGSSWGPRLEYILTNAIRLLLDAPGSTLLGLPRLLVDDAYRARLTAHCADPIVRNFWGSEFESYDARFKREAIAPVQNKIGTLLSPPALRNMLGQPKSTIDLRRIMDQGKVLIVNIAKGKLGEAPTHLLGAFLATGFAQAAEARADMPEESRRDFTLYADEFQNFATDSFASTLSEARKYRLSLVLAHQFIGQLDDKSVLLRKAVFGNVGTIFAFRLGADDAPLLAAELGLGNVQELTLTPNYSAWTKLMHGNTPSQAQILHFPPPHTQSEGRIYAVRKRTRSRNARPRSLVEEKILRFLSE